MSCSPSSACQNWGENEERRGVTGFWFSFVLTLPTGAVFGGPVLTIKSEIEWSVGVGSCVHQIRDLGPRCLSRMDGEGRSEQCVFTSLCLYGNVPTRSSRPSQGLRTGLPEAWLSLLS